MAATYPDDAAAFAEDMAKIDPEWLISRTQREWARYLGISMSNFANIKSGLTPYTTRRRALLESMARHKNRERKIEHRGQADLPAKMENYIIQQDTAGRYVLSRVVAIFPDKQEAENFSDYINRKTK